MVMRYVALVGLILAATPAFAQEPPPPPAWHQGDPGHRKFQARVAAIEAKLNLTPAQKPLWDSLVQVIRANMRGRVEHFRTIERGPLQDAPTHLDDRLAMLRQELHGVEQEKAALAPLWATLDAGQRVTLSKAIAWHPHYGKPDHHRPDSPE